MINYQNKLKKMGFKITSQGRGKNKMFTVVHKSDIKTSNLVYVRMSICKAEYENILEANKEWLTNRV